MIPGSIYQLTEVTYQKGLRNVILSPGSRSAPLSLAFIRHPDIQTRIISDERSAAYIALGMAWQTGRPVGVVSTSGTAAVNFYPAITEAFYLNIPLLVMTADRPPEWIDQADGQTIRQANLFDQHVKRSYIYPTHDPHPDSAWHRRRMISEALSVCHTWPSGPVHINIPLREPFYPEKNEQHEYGISDRVIRKTESRPHLSQDAWDQLSREWEKADKVLVLGGQQKRDETLSRVVSEFSNHHQVPVVGDVLSNLHEQGSLISLHDNFLLSGNDTLKKDLHPDLLITFGKSILAKNLKLFLRNHPPRYHWHIQPAGTSPDTFQALTTEIVMNETDFFEEALNRFKQREPESRYLEKWQALEKDARKKTSAFFPQPDFSELEAVWVIKKHLPDNSLLHLANSMPVRLMNFLGLTGSAGIETFSTRGTSGIDGSASVAVGTALATDRMTVLLTGDMAFFYDRNAYWHPYLPADLRIIVLNNHGGGIFRMIDGPSDLPELETYFETAQPLKAENSARDFGFEYVYCSHAEELSDVLPGFFEKSRKPKLLEVETNGPVNKKILDRFKSEFK